MERRDGDAERWSEQPGVPASQGGTCTPMRGDGSRSGRRRGTRTTACSSTTRADPPRPGRRAPGERGVAVGEPSGCARPWSARSSRRRRVSSRSWARSRSTRTTKSSPCRSGSPSRRKRRRCSASSPRRTNQAENGKEGARAAGNQPAPPQPRDPRTRLAHRPRRGKGLRSVCGEPYAWRVAGVLVLRTRAWYDPHPQHHAASIARSKWPAPTSRRRPLAFPDS